MQLMIAKKTMRYGGISVEPGEQFYVRNRHVAFLETTKRAAKTELPPTKPQETKPKAKVKPEKKAKAKPKVEDRSALREEYERLYGRKPWNGWDAAKLRERINEYDRRDMRAG